MMNQVQKIPLEEIDLSDETFSVNFRPDLADLRSSIEEVGLICPVLLRRRPGRFQIVCGFRRAAVLKETGSSCVGARVIEEEDELRLFRLSLHDNLTTRGFNAVEKAIVLEKLADRFGIDRSVLIAKFLPLLSLETNEKILETFLALARMEQGIKAYVLKEEVSRSNLRKLSRLSAEERKAALSLLVPLKVGENSLREILTLLEEISQRNRCPIGSLVEDPQIQALLAREELTPSQKTEKVKRALIGVRYPRMRQLEERFEKERKGLKLPRNITIHHQPNFEGKGLRVEFQFSSVDEFREALSTLLPISGEEPFLSLLEGAK
jgi:ParB/RepB/Spo0J family partition protein